MSFTVEVSPLVLDGTWIWKRGRAVIGISHKAQREFYGMFGLQQEAPREATGVILSPADYELLKANTESAKEAR